MYKLYYAPGACSLATHVLLLELGQPVELINKNTVSNFAALNPLGAVPVLVDGDKVLREGAALVLYLLGKHPNNLLATSGEAREQGIENLMLANASMHPAYSRLFFLSAHISDPAALAAGLQSAAQSINQLWRVVDGRLAQQPYLGGAQPSPADLLLTVYASWGQYFPVEITLGSHVERMIVAVRARPAFVQAVAAEQAQSSLQQALAAELAEAAAV
jgi:glutathione S-transferase